MALDGSGRRERIGDHIEVEEAILDDAIIIPRASGTSCLLAKNASPKAHRLSPGSSTGVPHSSGKQSCQPGDVAPDHAHVELVGQLHRHRGPTRRAAAMGALQEEIVTRTFGSDAQRRADALQRIASWWAIPRAFYAYAPSRQAWAQSEDYVRSGRPPPTVSANARARPRRAPGNWHR